MNHNPKFLARVDQARAAICECTVDEVIQAKSEGKSFTLIDVREESEFAAGHIPGAIHVSKGVIERDIESVIPDQDERLILYCGGGYRSAIAAESLVAMGYTNVTSMDGDGVAGGTPSSPLSVELARDVDWILAESDFVPHLSLDRAPGRPPEAMRDGSSSARFARQPRH